MAATFPLGRRASGGYYTDGTRNGHGATHEPSAGLGNPGGGSAARKTPAANASIRVFVEQVARPAKGRGEISRRLEMGPQSHRESRELRQRATQEEDISNVLLAATSENGSALS